MLIYCLKRILLFFPTLFGIILVTFLIIQTVPGGPVGSKLAQDFLNNLSHGLFCCLHGVWFSVFGVQFSDEAVCVF